VDAPTRSVVVGERQLELRRPTGLDQLLWAEHGSRTPETVRELIVRTLVVDAANELGQEPIPDEVADAIGEALQRFDPLVSLPIDVTCPTCGHTREHEVDVQDEALRRLRVMQATLTRQIHRLARHYHWSEHDIVSMPATRRARYLSLLDEEVVA
jgi:hypothetical protein